ncbi:hypothetical protein R1sor_009124 [Riccia sorocarpa]|uniref:Uncharacterized protein n=1 Tax=Riccia sorocarpa TaxID=122646 RepID=A0ABD3H4W8_9MARC
MAPSRKSRKTPRVDLDGISFRRGRSRTQSGQDGMDVRISPSIPIATPVTAAPSAVQLSSPLRARAAGSIPTSTPFSSAPLAIPVDSALRARPAGSTPTSTPLSSAPSAIPVDSAVRARRAGSTPPSTPLSSAPSAIPVDSALRARSDGRTPSSTPVRVVSTPPAVAPPQVIGTVTSASLDHLPLEVRTSIHMLFSSGDPEIGVTQEQMVFIATAMQRAIFARPSVDGSGVGVGGSDDAHGVHVGGHDPQSRRRSRPRETDDVDAHAPKRGRSGRRDRHQVMELALDGIGDPKDDDKKLLLARVRRCKTVSGISWMGLLVVSRDGTIWLILTR